MHDLDSPNKPTVPPVNPTGHEPTIKLWHVISALLFLLVVYCGVVPLFTAWRHGTFQPAYFLTDAIERIVETVIALWFFAFGACIGSFLNVVVYRLPRGLPITGSSFCPDCRNSIAWYDNIPIFAWLHLRAKCRNCQLPISSRYPVIELLVGLVFFVVAILELSLAGINLPSYVSSRTGFGLNLTQLDPPLAPIYGCHVATLAALITNALIVRDGTAEDQRTTFPKRIAIAVGAVICLVVIVWPTIHGAEEFSNSEALGTSRLWTIVAGLFFGAIAGVAYLVGRQIRLPADTDSRNVEFLPTAIILGFSLVGITFGRTAVSQVAAICCYLQLASLVMPNRIRRFLMAPAESLACSAILFVLLWRWLPIASHSMLSSAILTVASAVAAGVVTKYTGAHVAKVIHRGEQSNPL